MRQSTATIYILMIMIVGAGSSRGQTQEVHGNVTIEEFHDFIELFYPITEDDSLLSFQPIGLGSYQKEIIDSNYFSFVHVTPYFTPYAAFKVNRPNGLLVCVWHNCPSDFAGLQYVEFLTFNLYGVLRDRTLIPFRKEGCLNGDFFDDTEISVSNSLLQIQVERVFLGEEGGSKTIKDALYKIDDNGNLIGVSE